MNELRKHAWLDRADGWIKGIAIIVVLGVSAIVEVRGCAGNEDDARRMVEDAGYEHVDVGGPDRWACSSSDMMSNTFTARAANGHDVHGVVCCGVLFKNCTVRFR